MGLDGAFLRAVVFNLKKYVGARVSKILQLSHYELVFVLKKLKETKNLMISINPSSPAIYFTKNIQKTKTLNFSFETLLRNRLKTSFLVDLEQDGLDRILKLYFSAKDEIGQQRDFVLCLEFLGRYGNIIFYDLDSLKIEDSIKRVSIDSFPKRPVLPKLKFASFKEQTKINILEQDSLFISKKILEQKEKKLEDAIVETLEGFSFFIARIIGFPYRDVLIKDFSEKDRAFVFDFVSYFKDILKHGRFKFMAIFQEGRLKDFSFFDVKKFVDFFETKEFETIGELLDFFFEEKIFLHRQKQRENSIVRFLKREIVKAENKIKVREEDLKAAVLKKEYRKYGDLLAANLYRLKKGQTEILVENFFDGGKPVLLKLDPKLTASQNVSYYYRAYKKAKMTKEKMKDFLVKAKEDLNFLQNEYQLVKRCTNEEDLLEILKELNEENFHFDFGSKNIKKKTVDSKKAMFLRFKSSDGFYFFCGKNSRENEILTLKKAKKEDVWFHIKDISGSHVVVFSNGKKISNTAIFEAATVAAYYSDAHDENKADVWYTLILNVSKQKGTKLGMVNFKNVKTITVPLDFELVKRLKQD